ncbi:transporter substrate-binding domain-containing protein [Lactococcus kimchii]|uniref:transporter substrate-binding domain-containing protein n=1 Tax=Lactococcus sp. S-13 TaxID=2507158 RepID=UPI001022FC82|nr:transporter substrate-binding domain-containing protein [Lactococcus sp. S-13]RZI49211.1 transporter substrate-binding domain-containing protein [Lactococcus sp. S-13]
MKKFKIISLATLGLASVALLAACSSQKNLQSKTASQKVTTVTVATSGSSVPYEYSVDGKMTGFEYDILKAADKDMKDYKFKFKVYDDNAILTALDGGRAQIAANNFGKTKAREEKYLFSYPVRQGIDAIFSTSKENITKISQLAGKTTEIPTGTNYGDMFDTWNSKHPDKKINVKYSQRALTDRLSAISSGQIDFLFASKAAAENLVKEHAITGLVDTIPTDLNKQPDFKTYDYFVLDNSQSQLQKDLNVELKKLYENGTLKKLSEKYFKDSHIPAADQFKS